MDQKLTIADLAIGLSRRASLPLRYSEDFVRSFFKLIEEGLMHDNIVKIKGFGTFKLVGVEPRESVNVNTGERFEIAGHTKVSFTPDPAMRDGVNKPFLEFETVILNEGTDISQMEAIDDESLLPEDEVAETIEKMVQEAQASEMKSEEDMPTPEPAASEPAPDKEMAVHEKPVAEMAAEAHVDRIHSPETATPPTVSQDERVPENSSPATPTPNAVVPEGSKPTANADGICGSTPRGGGVRDAMPSCHHGCWLHGLFFLLSSLFFMALGYVVAYYWRPVTLPDLCPATTTEEVSEEATPTQAVTVDAATPKIESSQPMYPEEVRPEDTVIHKREERKVNQPSEILAYPQLEDGDYWIVGVEATEVMRPGKTLLNISLKYYKSKDFVNYICTMNDIKNPDIVPLDKELRIPKLQKKQ